MPRDSKEAIPSAPTKTTTQPVNESVVSRSESTQKSAEKVGTIGVVVPQTATPVFATTQTVIAGNTKTQSQPPISQVVQQHTNSQPPTNNVATQTPTPSTTTTAPAANQPAKTPKHIPPRKELPPIPQRTRQERSQTLPTNMIAPFAAGGSLAPSESTNNLKLSEPPPLLVPPPKRPISQTLSTTNIPVVNPATTTTTPTTTTPTTTTTPAITQPTVSIVQNSAISVENVKTEDTSKPKTDVSSSNFTTSSKRLSVPPLPPPRQRAMTVDVAPANLTTAPIVPAKNPQTQTSTTTSTDPVQAQKEKAALLDFLNSPEANALLTTQKYTKEEKSHARKSIFGTFRMKKDKKESTEK